MAWHAQEMNALYLGIEFEQGHRGEEITPIQYDAAAAWLQTMFDKYGHDLTMVEHWATAQGRRNGKSDIQPPFDVEELWKRLTLT